jgi:hypothetical protein
VGSASLSTSKRCWEMAESWRRPAVGCGGGWDDAEEETAGLYEAAGGWGSEGAKR